MRMINAVRDFLKLESASGILLVGAGILAMIVANSPFSHIYGVMTSSPITMDAGSELDSGASSNSPLWIFAIAA